MHDTVKICCCIITQPKHTKKAESQPKTVSWTIKHSKINNILYTQNVATGWKVVV